MPAAHRAVWVVVRRPWKHVPEMPSPHDYCTNIHTRRALAKRSRLGTPAGRRPLEREPSAFHATPDRRERLATTEQEKSSGATSSRPAEPRFAFSLRPAEARSSPQAIDSEKRGESGATRLHDGAPVNRPRAAMAKETSKPTPSRSWASAYWEQSRRPLAALAFVVPLLVLYEGGVVLLGPQAVRNGADVWLRQVFDLLGFGQYFLLPAMTVGLLLAWHHLTHDRWQVSVGVLYVMFAECAVLGLAAGDSEPSGWSAGGRDAVGRQAEADDSVGDHLADGRPRRGRGALLGIRRRRNVRGDVVSACCCCRRLRRAPRGWAQRGRASPARSCC